MRSFATMRPGTASCDSHACCCICSLLPATRIQGTPCRSRWNTRPVHRPWVKYARSFFFLWFRGGSSIPTACVCVSGACGAQCRMPRRIPSKWLQYAMSRSDRRASERRLILDAGSGIVGVGNVLDGVTEIPIVLTHYHWDHVQGLPFFAPLYRAGAPVSVWALRSDASSRDIEAMFEAPFFPVPYDRLPSRPASQHERAGG